MSKAANQLAVIAVALYATSFFLPAVVYQGDSLVGLAVFLGIPFLLPLWPALPASAANPVFLFGIADIVLGQFKRARQKGLVASLLAATVLPWMWNGTRAGYALWVFSMLLLLIAGHQGLLHERRQAAEPEHPRHDEPVVTRDARPT